MGYRSPIDVIVTDMELKLRDGIDDAVMAAVQEVGDNVDKDELLKALEGERDQYRKGYSDGEWELFELITAAYYGKQYYSLQENGLVYSRLRGISVTKDEAISEFLGAIGG